MLRSLSEIASELTQAAYPARVEDDVLVTKIGNFRVAMVVVDDYLSITCHVVKLGEIREDSLPEFFAAAVAKNMQLNPYALAMITSAYDPELIDESEYQIVLTNKVSLHSFDAPELGQAMQDLRTALSSIRDVLVAGGIGNLVTA